MKWAPIADKHVLLIDLNQPSLQVARKQLNSVVNTIQWLDRRRQTSSGKIDRNKPEIEPIAVVLCEVYSFDQLPLIQDAWGKQLKCTENK